MRLRPEQPADVPAIRSVNLRAFEGPGEAALVDALRRQAHPTISLVAELGGDVVGQITFSPVVHEQHPELTVMGLAPMAVVPDLQGQGIGSALVRAGIDRCRNIGTAALIVLGHPAFYPRFGFVPAAEFGIDSAYDVPEGVFMAMELQPDALRGKPGRVSYHPAFADLE